MYTSTSCEVKITVKPAIKNDTVDVRDELWLVAVRSLCLDIWSPPSWSLCRVHFCTNKKEKVCSIDMGVEGKVHYAGRCGASPACRDHEWCPTDGGFSCMKAIAKTKPTSSL